MYRTMIAAVMFAIVAMFAGTAHASQDTITITRVNDVWDHSAGYVAYTYNDRVQYGYYECNGSADITSGVYPVFDLITRGGSVISLHFTTNDDVTCMIESDDNGTLNTAYITYDTTLDSYMYDSAALDGYNAVAMTDRYENDNARVITYKITTNSTVIAMIASYDSVIDVNPNNPAETITYTLYLPITSK